MSIRFAIFAINDGVNCTETATKMANYLGSDPEKRVAIIEANSLSIYQEFNITRPDGIYELNNLHYIPYGNLNYDESEYDYIIKDYGKVNALFSFNEEFDKIYLCEESNPSNIFEMSDFLTEQNINCDILLFEASKDDLSAYKSYGYSCINIENSCKNICSYGFYLQLSLFLRKNKLNPPEYNKNAEYTSIVYKKDVISDEVSTKKKGFFNKKPKVVNNKEIKSEQIDDTNEISTEDKVEQMEEDYPVQAAKESIPVQIVEEKPKQSVIKAHNSETLNYVPVPKPKPIEISKDEEKKQIEIEKAIQVYEKEKPPVVDKTKEIELENALQKKQEKIDKQQQEVERLRIIQEEQAQKDKVAELKYKQELLELKYKSTHDQLTDVKNRAGFDESLDNAQDFVLIAFDVNNLKYVNDTFGHDRGDVLLKTISETLSNVFGKENVYRMGGDEFDVLLINESIIQKNLQKQLKSIDHILEKKTKHSEDIIYQVAYGFAYSSEGTIADVIKAADERMYEDKKEKKKSLAPEPVKEETIIEESLKEESTDNECLSIEDSINEVPTKETPTEEKPQKKGFFLFNKEKSVIKNIPKTIPKKTNSITGHMSIFITSLRHSCGTSYVTGSLASALTDIYDRDVWIDHKPGDILPDNIMVKEIVSDIDRFNAYKTGIVLYDKGLQKDLSPEDKAEMLRADVNIMVSTADEVDLKNLAAFIKKDPETASKWLFVFNHVQPTQKRLLQTIMRNYNHLILPPHDYSELPTSVRKDWKNAITYCISVL